MKLNSNFHAYANDIQLYLSRPIGLVADMCCRLNEYLLEIELWSCNNGLLIYPNKSYVIEIKYVLRIFLKYTLIALKLIL